MAPAKSNRPGNTRVTGKEQFYTPQSTAELVLDLVEQVLPNWNQFPFLEPAGGTGTFIEEALRHGATDLHSWDIEPLHPKVQTGDFLTQRLDFVDAVCISNPPFGRNNALSIPFFNHAAGFSQLIAFVVPRSWRKWSVQNKLDRNFQLVQDQNLQVDYLDANGRAEHGHERLRTCVQVWVRGDTPREIIKVRDPGLIAKCGPQEADVALTVFGFGCGTVRTDFPREPNTTQMFLKLLDHRALDALQSVDYSRFYLNTAYTEALSLAEINFLLSEYLENQ